MNIKHNIIEGKDLFGLPLSNNIQSVNYNPFFDNVNYISNRPLTIEEMNEYGFTGYSLGIDDVDGYYAYIYYK